MCDVECGGQKCDSCKDPECAGSNYGMTAMERVELWEIDGMDILRDGVKVGWFYFTHHPTIRYEVYSVGPSSSKRVNTREECLDFVKADIERSDGNG